MRTNLHATAIVMGTHGLLFLGPSGAGKSSLALACMEGARQAGQFSALIADDQVLVENLGGRAIAIRPQPTAGLLEVRHSGIASTASIEAAVLHLAVMLVDRIEAERLPPQTETHALPCGLHLPLLRMAADTPAPAAVLRMLMPDLLLNPGDQGR